MACDPLLGIVARLSFTFFLRGAICGKKGGPGKERECVSRRLMLAEV